MDKPELVEEVANQTGLTKRMSREALNAMISAITNSLAREEKVTLVGFGTFQVMERKPRKERNPRTGQSIQTAARKTPKFRAGKGLRQPVGEE